MRKMAKRSLRLSRLAVVGDVLAKASEADAAIRRREVDDQNERLCTVTAYRDEYAGSLKRAEVEAVTLDLVRARRQFSWWLSDLAVEQSGQLEQAKFLCDAAESVARERRTFAKALESISDKAAEAAKKQSFRDEQKLLDEVAATRMKNLAL